MDNVTSSAGRGGHSSSVVAATAVRDVLSEDVALDIPACHYSTVEEAFIRAYGEPRYLRSILSGTDYAVMNIVSRAGENSGGSFTCDNADQYRVVRNGVNVVSGDSRNRSAYRDIVLHRHTRQRTRHVSVDDGAAWL